MGSAKKEFVTKVVGPETHTFDIGSAKYAVKYQKSVDAIANHVLKEYMGGPKIAKAILPMILIPNYPTANLGGNVDPGDIRSSTMSITTLILCQIVLKCMI